MKKLWEDKESLRDIGYAKVALACLVALVFCWMVAWAAGVAFDLVVGDDPNWNPLSFWNNH